MARRVGFGDSAPVREKPRFLRILFLFLWMLGWSFGMWWVIAALINGPVDADTTTTVMMYVWLAFAFLGWAYGARLLRRALRGERLTRGRRGERPNAPSARLSPARRSEDGPGESGDRGFD